jgi:hypothetical protein
VSLARFHVLLVKLIVVIIVIVLPVDGGSCRLRVQTYVSKGEEKHWSLMFGMVFHFESKQSHSDSSPSTLTF